MVPFVHMRLLPNEIQLAGVHFVSFDNLAGKEIKKLQ